MMPRQAATIERDVTLFLILHIVMPGVRTLGEDPEQVIVRKCGSHFYNVSIRTRPIERELRGMQTGIGATELALSGDGNDTCGGEKNGINDGIGGERK